MADASRYVDVAAEETSSEGEEGVRSTDDEVEGEKTGSEGRMGDVPVDPRKVGVGEDVVVKEEKKESEDGNGAMEKRTKFVDDLDEEEEEEEEDDSEEDEEEEDDEPKKRKRDEEELELDEDDYALLAEQGVVVRERPVSKGGVQSNARDQCQCGELDGLD